MFVRLVSGTFYNPMKAGVMDRWLQNNQYCVAENAFTRGEATCLLDGAWGNPHGSVRRQRRSCRGRLSLECVADSFHRSRKLSALFDSVRMGTLDLTT